MGQRRISPALVLAVVYGTFGVLWVGLSDVLLVGLVSDPHTLTLVQTSKGWLFVAISALLILAVAQRLMAAVGASEERYRLLFADSPQPMIVYDPATGRVVEANRATCRHFGYSAEELTHAPLLDLLAPEERPEARRMMERVRSSSSFGPETSARRVQCKDGRVVSVEATGHPVLFDGRLLRLVVLHDVTARLQAEAALIRALDRLARQEAERAQLTHALAHDLREPLRQVAGFVQLLARRYGGQLGEEADQYIGFATEGIHRLNELLSDLQHFTDSRTLAVAEIDSSEVLRDVLAVLAPQIEAAGAGICIGEMPVLRADRRSLSAVLLSLVENAVKFRQPGRPCRIHVTARRLDGDWEVSVRDNGIGIEPEYRESVFTLFGRLHTRDRVPGNGTGLALARKLVEASGGRIWAAEVAGDGADFRFTVPAEGPCRAANIDM